MFVLIVLFVIVVFFVFHNCMFQALGIEGGAAKGVKKDLSVKKQILASKPFVASTDQQFADAVIAVRNIMGMQEVQVDRVLHSMSVESLTDLKNEFQHGKSHVDSKAQQAYTFMNEAIGIKAAVDTLIKGTDHLQKITFEAFVKAFADENGMMKAISFVHAIDIVIAVKNAVPAG